MTDKLWNPRLAWVGDGRGLGIAACCVRDSKVRSRSARTRGLRDDFLCARREGRHFDAQLVLPAAAT